MKLSYNWLIYFENIKTTLGIWFARLTRLQVALKLIFKEVKFILDPWFVRGKTRLWLFYSILSMEFKV